MSTATTSASGRPTRLRPSNRFNRQRVKSGDELVGGRQVRRVVGVELDHPLARVLADHATLQLDGHRPVVPREHVRAGNGVDRYADPHRLAERCHRLRAVAGDRPGGLLVGAVPVGRYSHHLVRQPGDGRSPSTTMFAWTMSLAPSG